MAQRRATPRRTQDERSGATRGAVIAAARTLFAAHGFAETSIEQILAAAGVTRGALYHHFPGKGAIFLVVFETLEAELADRLVAAAAPQVRAWDRLLAGAQAFLDACLDPEVRRVVLLDAPAVLGVDEVRRVEALYTLARLRAGLAACAAEGELAANPPMLAHLILGALAQAAVAIAQASDPPAARAEAWLAARALLDGLRVKTAGGPLPS